MTKKLVLVETLTMFKHYYAVRVDENDSEEKAVDFVLNRGYNINEMTQMYLGEMDTGTRVIDEEEYLKLFDKCNSYLSSWTDENKKQFIYDEDKNYDNS